MKASGRRALAALTLFMACGALAQGYKCRQADGSTSYQDHPCAAGTASSSVLPGGPGSATTSAGSTAPGALANAQGPGLDPGCQAPVKRALSVCLGALKPDTDRCGQQTMSAECRAQERATGGRNRDSACVQQQLACNTQALVAAKQCIERELPPACRAQIDAAQAHRRLLRP